MNRLRRASRVHAAWLRCWTDGEHVRSVYAPEPPSWTCRGLDGEGFGGDVSGLGHRLYHGGKWAVWRSQVAIRISFVVFLTASCAGVSIMKLCDTFRIDEERHSLEVPLCCRRDSF